MDTDQKCAHGGDGAQRAEVVGIAGVEERVEQETHKKEVPGGSRRGPDGSRAGRAVNGVLTPDRISRHTPLHLSLNASPAPIRPFEIALSLYYIPPRCTAGAAGAQRVLRG